MFSVSLGPSAELRPLEPWRAAEFATAVERCRDHLRPWIPFATRVVDEESARVLLQDFADRQAADSGAMYGIWVDGELRGGTLFRRLQRRDGCGRGRSVAGPVGGRPRPYPGGGPPHDRLRVPRAGLTRIEWYCGTENTRSKAAADRLGMTYEGTLRSSFAVDGRRLDSEVWAVLASDWPPRPR
jgi:hypothetical protein